MCRLWEGRGERREKGWKLVTLTTVASKLVEERYDPMTLRTYVKLVRKAVGRFWRATRWGRRIHATSQSGKPTKRARRDTLYVVGIEVAPGGMVHAHLAVFGEYVSTTELRSLWQEACSVGGFVNVRAMRARDAAAFRSALREVLKYVSKGDKEPGKRTQRAAVIECALRGIRRVEMAGAIRSVPALSERDVSTNARTCEGCGQASSWKWRGIRAPDYVRRNRGFGLAHIVDDADASSLNAERRTYYKNELTRERAIGGRFYGGSPPPWMNDSDDWDTVSDGRDPLTWAT